MSKANFDDAKEDLKDYVKIHLAAYQLDDLDAIRLLQELALELLNEAKKRRGLP